MQQSIPQNLPTPPSSSDLVAAPATAVSPDQLGNQLKNLEVLQERANQLELRLADMNVRVNQLAMQRDRASDADRPKIEKQWVDAQHDMNVVAIELSGLHGRISQLERLLNPQTAITFAPPAPPRSSELDSEQIMQVVGGAGMLMIPLILVAARNMWIRGSRRSSASASVDIESSPRLQRMEQAIEAIAVEVERIGEGQRFSTKLLSERQPDAVANRAAVPVPRREPGSITPH